MKRMVILAVLGLAVGLGVGADSRDDWAVARASVKVSDLTVGDWKALSDAQSVDRQKSWYIHGAAFESFVLPGWGQFKTGDALAGTLNLAGFAALVGGTVYGAWALLPSDLKAEGLSRSARHDLMGHYWDTDPGRLAPALGVAAGGMAVTLLYRIWSASDARTRAQENVADGKVSFEPAAFNGFFGFRGRM